MHQLLSGLHECHQMQLIHRDIKSTHLSSALHFVRVCTHACCVSCVCVCVCVWPYQAPTF
jgi:serine/threonine protein kinase